MFRRTSLVQFGDVKDDVTKSATIRDVSVFEKLLNTISTTGDDVEDCEKNFIPHFGKSSLETFYSKVTSLKESRAADKLEMFQKLMELGFAGSVPTQRMFAHILGRLLQDNSVIQRLGVDVTIGNVIRDHLFGSERPRILSRLIWCSNFDDEVTKGKANKALDSISKNISGDTKIFKKKAVLILICSYSSS